MDMRWLRTVETVLQVAVVWVGAGLTWLLVSPLVFTHTALASVLPEFTRPFLQGTTVEAPLAKPARIASYSPTTGVEVQPPYAELRAVTAQVDLQILGAWDRALYVVGPLLLASLALVGLVLLLRMVRDTSRGDAFVAANARRMMTIGLLIAAATPAALAGDFARAHLLESSNVASFVGSSFALPLWPLAVGAIVSFIGEVFRQGARLREDVEGLV